MSQLNCKVGDLAIVVNTELPQNLGQIVEVLGAPTSKPLTLNGRGHIWRVRTVSGRKTLTYLFHKSGQRKQYAVGPAPDRCLRPVSGLTDLDGGAVVAAKKKPTPRRKRKVAEVVTGDEVTA